MNKTESREKLDRFIDELEGDNFFGIVELHYEAGQIVRVKKHETMLFEEVDSLTNP